MSTRQVGHLGERLAENYLKNKGYQILDKNYSLRILGNLQKGEIDIVAKKSDIISFIEVKSLRKGPGTVPSLSPELKLNFEKRKRLIRTAEAWLMAKKIPLNSKWQIDVILVMMDRREAEISHFENAIPYY